MFSTLFFFLVTLFILITFHEFGHFYVARKCGVHVLRFSIGFGKALFTLKDKKGTEFVLSAIPLGGYVKMLGESSQDTIPESIKASAFYLQPAWKRIMIVAAGPVFNLVLAVIALWVMFMVGITSLAPVIGKIEPGSPVALSQVKAMDEIMTIDDVSVNNWHDVQIMLLSGVGEKQPLVLRLYNLKTHTYHFVNLSLEKLSMASGTDIITELGIMPALPKVEPVISKVYPGLPGEKAGLKKNDRILSVNGKKIHDWFDVLSITRKNPGEKLVMQLQRKGIIISVTVYPQIKKINGKTYGFVGAEPKSPKHLDDIWLRTERYLPIKAFGIALNETWRLTKVSVQLMEKLLTGALSLNTISGPIGMAQVAGQAAHLGWTYYLSFIALVSVSLGVLNLLPIPMLDGGHLLYYAYEIIRRRPLSEKTRLAGMRLGFLLLAGLMFLAVFNDISRLYLSWV